MKFVIWKMQFFIFNYRECAEIEFADIVKNEELREAIWKQTVQWTKQKELEQ
jgi:hypothetical protein